MTTGRPADVGPARPPSGKSANTDATAPPLPRLRHLATRLLRVPLFHKVLWANAGAVALAAGFATWFTATHGLGRSGGPGPLGAAILIAAAGGLASAMVHVFLLRRALAPLKELASVASRLQDQGTVSDLRARIPPTADRNLAHLIRVFNGMLDSMSDYRTQLRRVTARTLEAAEEERKQIARRLQEDTAQRLAALLVRLQVVRRTADPERRDAALEELREEAALALESVRRTARHLHPPELEDIGLERALRAFARTLVDGDGHAAPRLDLDLDPVGDELEERERFALYRILQEAIRTARARAGARNVRVELRRDDDLLRAVVRDDGRAPGADGPGPDDEELGLLTMRERAIHAGGSLRVTGRPGGGTSVCVELPLLRRDTDSGPRLDG